MQKIRLAIVTVRNFECCDLYKVTQTQIRNQGLNMTVNKIYVEDIIIQHNIVPGLIIDDENIIDKYDVFLFRIDLKKNLNKIYVVARILKNSNKLIINTIFATGNTFSDKLSIIPILQKLNLNHPKTLFIDSKKILQQQLGKIDLPFIAKDPYGWQGEDIFLIKTFTDAQNLLNNFPHKGLIIQKYLQIDYDIRVIVIGFKALGAIKRTNPKDDFRSNLSLGGNAKQIQLTKELREISERIAKHTQSEMLGIDFFLYNNKIYVNEIETCPGFNGFKKATNISPLSKLLQYIIQKSNL